MVLERSGAGYRILLQGSPRDASLRGRFKQDTGETVVPGDRVVADAHPDGSVTIESLVPRRNQLRRRTPGRRRGTRVVAANIDDVVVVGSAVDPEWDPMMMDRFLAVVGANQLHAVVVVNKVDLDRNAEALAEPYRRIGYPVYVTSADSGLGITELRAEIAGRTTLFTGSTGVGKSSLLNLVQPGLDLRTGAISEKSRTGRHTTVTAVMCPSADGGFLIDSPGLRDISLWGLAPDEVERAFPEINEMAGACRFDDCRHGVEPDCAVKAGVAEGEIQQSRLASFRRLLEEATEASKPWEGLRDR